MTKRLALLLLLAPLAAHGQSTNAIANFPFNFTTPPGSSTVLMWNPDANGTGKGAVVFASTLTNLTATGSTLTAATGGGGGSVTNFSAGDLSPIFTTTEATTTTTPALSFALTGANAHSFLGNNTNTTPNTPAYVQPALTDLASGTSADLAAVLSDETGTSGGFVRANAATLTNTTQNQSSNGASVSAVYGTRFTDTSPVGHLLLFQNAAANTDLWDVDVTGQLNNGVIPAARLINTIATARLGTGTANNTTFLRGDQTWAVPAGAGTVTATGGSLTSNALVLGAGTTDTKVAAGLTSDGTSKLTLGVAGTSVGSIDFKNATSGTITLQPPTGALGTVTATMPLGGTLATLDGTETFTNKSIAASQLTGTIAAARMPALTGDVTTSSGAVATTLATVNSNTGAFGSATVVPAITVNGKGLITAVSTNTITAAGAYLGTQILTGGTTYTPTSGTNTVHIRMVGGGGAGGGAVAAASQASVASGGGAGAYLEKTFGSVSGTYSYSIGSAGTGVTGAAGNPGTSTSFTNGGTTYTAPGGSFGGTQASGTSQSVQGEGAGGSTATNGDINSGGESGRLSIRISGTSGQAGSGGSSPLGSGGLKAGAASPAAGSAATGYGGGGGGAASASATSFAGGDGSPGVIIIDEYR